jgi:gluconolactonase
MTGKDESGRNESSVLSRRTLVGAIAIGAGATVVGSRGAMAQAQRGVPQTVVTSPPRDFGPSGAPSTYFWDPDIIFVDPLFRQYVQPNTPIMRLWTGSLWAEGPAWNAQGRYLVWSDIPNNRQLRWLEDTGRRLV